MAKQRIKQAAIEAAQDKTEVTAHIRAIGDLNREIKRLETDVAAYCEAHKDDLTENGKTKTVDFVTGLVKWRIRPPSVKVTGVAAVLAWMSEKTAYQSFIRTKQEIDKDAILNEREQFANGQVPGIKIVSGLEDFVIEPTEQELM